MGKLRMHCVDKHNGGNSISYTGSEENLNRYLDGLTTDREDVQLFAHLSACVSCRRQLNAVLEFRRLTQGERFDVPLWTDQQLFKRIEARRSDRKTTRHGVLVPARAWSGRTKVSVRSAALALAIACALLVLFLNGAARRTATVSAVQERVDFVGGLQPDPVYVFYPGVVVEESR